MLRANMAAQRGASSNNDVVIGVVGDGFGALQIYATAIYLGFAPEQIGIFGENLNPAQTYQQFAWNLGQTILRSESESHFLPADWPTFGQLTAVAHRDVTPLFRSAVRTLNPGVPAILTEMEIVVRELGYERRVLGGEKVGWVVREPDPVPHFSFHNEQGQLLGRAKHAAIAIGHGPLAFPGVFGMARNDPETGPYVVQAYEAKRYRPGGVYIVVGSGIAAVNEEVNVLDAGASCIALRRNPHPDEQDLNVPRCLFDGSGIDAFQALSFEERLDFLGVVLKGTAPTRRGWEASVKEGHKEGRYEQQVGEVTAIDPGPAGLTVTLAPYGSTTPVKLDVTGIVLSTGFVKNALSLPLLRRLVQLYDVPLEAGRVRLKTNCGIPPLDRADSRLCMFGLNANTVVPNGDTIAGLKYMARRFVGDVSRAEHLHRRHMVSRLALQLRLARHVEKSVRHVHKTRQLA
jgi:hypothetical protein